jgi:hypothetical protein
LKFFINFGGLIYIGSSPAEAPYVLAGQICTSFYFLYFIVIIPLLPFCELAALQYKFLAKDLTRQAFGNFSSVIEPIKLF